jgi:nucleotide-binding universal stress UspA family protein
MSDVPQTVILVAYDGSEEAHHAVREAGRLFPGRPALVVTVWEPALASVGLAPGVGLLDAPAVGLDPMIAGEVDEASEEHARRVAADGADRAGEAGLDAQALPVRAHRGIVDTLIDVARERDAAAVVVGSRGLGGFRAGLLGSTSRGILHGSHRPVLVVRRPEDAGG